VFTSDQVDPETGFPLKKQRPVSDVAVTCPTADGVSVAWAGDVVLAAGTTGIGLMAMADLDGSGETFEDAGVSPYAGGVISVADNGIYPDIELIVTLGPPPESVRIRGGPPSR
jgi:hypothetical protein